MDFVTIPYSFPLCTYGMFWLFSLFFSNSLSFDCMNFIFILFFCSFVPLAFSLVVRLEEVLRSAKKRMYAHFWEPQINITQPPFELTFFFSYFFFLVHSPLYNTHLYIMYYSCGRVVYHHNDICIRFEIVSAPLRYPTCLIIKWSWMKRKKKIRNRQTSRKLRPIQSISSEFLWRPNKDRTYLSMAVQTSEWLELG